MRLNKVEFLSFGEDRIYAKEQALLDLLTEELANDRPCVVYLRQTATRDIQPRIKKLISQHVPDAVPYILKNTVQAERREKVIEAERAKGMNVLICNPELVKTGLDLLFSPTLIFWEITFSLGTMMQAAARSYRLNQTHKHCKVYYIYAEGTMEHTAVQLMSRKQRAAKLLTGEVGLTGLDALTEGEGGFEEALMDAIAKDEALLDPSEMFKVSAGQSEIDAEDMAYWNVEVDETSESDALLTFATQELGAEIDRTPIPMLSDKSNTLLRYVTRYLDTVHLIHDDARRAKLQAQLLSMLRDGVQNDDGTYKVIGMKDADFSQYPVHEETLTRAVTRWLKQHRFVFAGCEQEVAEKVIDLAKQALGLIPTKLDLFEKLQDMRDEEIQQSAPVILKRELPGKHRKTINLNAIPDEETEEATYKSHPFAVEPASSPPQQLAMF